MNENLLFLILILSAYFIGSIPTGVIISKLFFGFDIRKKGSGNMGSTNAFRVLGWKWGLAVQIIDMLKGVAAVLVADWLYVELDLINTTFSNRILVEIVAGTASVLGHIFSAFVSFKGGKGINTTTGMLIAIAPVEIGVTALFFILAFFSSGFVSLGSLISAITLPLVLIFRENFFGVDIPGYFTLLYFFIAISLLVFYTHRANIKRLIDGTESRFEKFWLIKFKRG